jgi:Domain of unknown function (DUF4337)
LEIHEGVELPEHVSEHEANPLTVPVSVTISILAVLVAGATLMGHRTHTEELLLQSHATDQWAYYQAKNLRQNNMQTAADHQEGFADVLSVVGPPDKTSALREKHLKKAEADRTEVQRYQAEKSDISEEAKKLETERDLVSRRADRFDGGEALIEVGLVICSITLLTRRRPFWFTGMLIGGVGVAFALTGLFLH